MRLLKIFTSIAVAGCVFANGLVNGKATPLKINYPGYFGNRINIPADNPTTVEGVYLGRMLFYETALSANNEISCATCHQQKLTFYQPKAI